MMSFMVWLGLILEEGRLDETSYIYEAFVMHSIVHRGYIGYLIYTFLHILY